MPTTRALIRGSLRLLGVVESGENVQANEAFDALEAFNALLESWSLERLVVYHIGRFSVPLLPGQPTYTWGPGGDIGGLRPLRLENALLNLGTSVGASGPLEWPVAIWSQDEYERGIWLKQMGSQYVLGVYLETSFPLARLHVWPVPFDSTTSLILFPWLPLTRAPDLDTPIDYPPGYERMLRFGLACEMAPEYGVEIPAAVASGFIQARTNIKTLGVIVPLMAQPIHSTQGTSSSLGASRYDIRSDWR